MNGLMKSEKWDQMMKVENGELVFLAAGVDEYTKDDTEFRELIVLAINWTGGLTGRGMEILSLLFKNKMAAGRNLIVRNGQFMVATEYHKSQAITDDIKVRLDIYDLIIADRTISSMGPDEITSHIPVDRGSIS
jgi:hypothetical protein